MKSRLWQTFRTHIACAKNSVLYGLIIALFGGTLPVAAEPLPPPDSAGAIWAWSPNQEPRLPSYVILHHTAYRDADHVIDKFLHADSRVSAHYLITRTGVLYQFVPESARAWHAGASRWRNEDDLNSRSIGIELDNDGFEPYPEAQLVQLFKLLDELRSRYDLPAGRFIGHADIAPTRKIDPNVNFPWERLAALGFGHWAWSKDTTVPADLSIPQTLAEIGYDLRQPQAALTAFKRHFIPHRLHASFSAEDAQVLARIAQQYRTERQSRPQKEDAP